MTSYLLGFYLPFLIMMIFGRRVVRVDGEIYIKPSKRNQFLTAWHRTFAGAAFIFHLSLIDYLYLKTMPLNQVDESKEEICCDIYLDIQPPVLPKVIRPYISPTKAGLEFHAMRRSKETDLSPAEWRPSCRAAVSCICDE